MVGKNYSVRECVDILWRIRIEVRIARYHNIYGPFGTYDGGREKAPAFFVGKLLMLKKMRKELKSGVMETN